MALSADAAKRMMIALASKDAGLEVVDAINDGQAGAAQDFFAIRSLIVATNVSTTIDFGVLAVSDKILILPAAAGNAQFVTCAVAGTLPQAAVVGSLYVVLRAFADPAADTSKF
jgi:hypothetical protein